MRIFTICSVLSLSNLAFAQVELVAKIAVPGDARDLSKLRSVATSSVPQNRLGGFGSAIDFDPETGLLWSAVDRGPADGESVYKCRLQVFRLDIEKATAEVVNTVMLSRDGEPLVGDIRALAAEQALQARLDPEGLRVIPGGIVTSEEYGPFIDVFDRDGTHRRRIAPPAKFMVNIAADTPEGEMPPNNSAGRQANKGFEGLALSRDGSKLYAILQGPLLQDNPVDARNKKIGLGLRVLEASLDGGTPREFVYVLDKPKNGVSEILALDSERFLVLERDGDRGRECKHRTIYAATIAGATDVSGVDSLPSSGAPDGATAMRKEVFIDLLDPKFGLAGDTMPEKIEGLTFGPKLADGRSTLIVSVDNDCKAEFESWFWVFAFQDSAIPTTESIMSALP